MKMEAKPFKQFFLPFFISLILAVMCGAMSAFILDGKRDCYRGDVIYLNNCADETTLFLSDCFLYLVYGFAILSIILPCILISRSQPIEQPKIFD